MARSINKCVALSLLLCIATAARLDAHPNVYRRALESTGWLINPSDKNVHMGTCWVVDRERKWVLTSAHLIGESREALVYFPQSKKGSVIPEAKHYLRNEPSIHGTVLATDKLRDLTLVQLDRLPDNIKAFELADEGAQPGDEVFSIGNSGLADGSNVLWRYTRGSVRLCYRRHAKLDSGEIDVRLVETQSPVNQGDSGGALLNEHGKVVGVVTAFDPNERLVSDNVDLVEIKSFLATNVARLESAKKDSVSEPEEKKSSLVGAWKVSTKLNEEVKSWGEASFTDDGHYRLGPATSKSEAKSGRYAYANGILLLMLDDNRAFLKLAWDGSNSFSATTKGVELKFDR